MGFLMMEAVSEAKGSFFLFDDCLTGEFFASDPGAEIRAELKKMKFRWNPFRKEFCGFAQREECERLLHGTDYTIEIVS